MDAAPWGAARGALVAVLVLLADAALRGLLDLRLSLVGLLALVAGGILLAPRRRRPEASASRPPPDRPALAEALLANIPDPVILVDARVLVLEANPAARALLPALRIGQPLSFALRAPEVLDGIEAVLRTGAPSRVAYVQRVPTERAFEVQVGAMVQAVVGEGADGPGTDRPSSVVLFLRDLTAARRLEHMRVDFVANASHELRTPLASLLGFIETLQGAARDDGAARERFLAIMREQALRMTRLIDDLLSLSRIELRAHLPPDTPLDLVPLARHVADALGPLARERGVTIALEAEPAPCRVRGERDELVRVVENLVENAVKYGEGGGRVEVAVRRRPPRDGRPAEVELAVRDHGPGIAPEHVPRLTERFYRVDVAESRQKGGTGLGLAIVKHIVAHHRGRLQVESELGRGALFRVLIPEALDRVAAAEGESGPRSASRNRHPTVIDTPPTEPRPPGARRTLRAEPPQGESP